MSVYRIQPLFQGKRAFFSIIKEATPTEPAETFDVQIQVGCTCKYMNYKNIYGNTCKHARMALDKLSDGNPFVDPIRPSDAAQAKRNECLQLVKPMNRKVNQIRYGENEGPAHRNEKVLQCERLEREGKHYVCEAIFEKGGRADILVLDDFRAIEIASSETDESLEAKRKAYPRGISMTVVRL